MSNKESIIIRKIRDKDFPNLYEFYSRVWPDIYIYKYPHRLNWIIKKNPFIPKGFNYPIWIAEVNGRIVGHTSALIIPYLVDGKEMLCSTSVDTIVDTKYRGRSLGQKLQLINRNSNALFVSIGIAPINQHIKSKQGNQYGQNVFSMHYFYGLDKSVINKAIRIKLAQKSKLLERIVSSLFLPNVFSNLLEYRMQSPKLSTKSILIYEEVQNFDSRFDLIWDKCRKNYELCAERTAKYLDWKYSKVPHLNYHKYLIKEQDKNIGVLIFRVGNQDENYVVLVAELYFTHFNELWYKDAFGYLNYFFVKKNVTSINFYTTEKNIFNISKSLGFKHIETITPMFYSHNELSKKFAEMKTYISRGESDLDQHGLLHQPYLSDLVKALFKR